MRLKFDLGNESVLDKRYCIRGYIFKQHNAYVLSGSRV